MSSYTVKFLFADATFLEQTFALDITVLGAKQQLIAAWPAGNISHQLTAFLF